MDLYVYYRVRSDHAHQLQTQVSAMQRALSQNFGVHCALKRRPEEKDGCQTWMETYTAVPEGFAHTLANAAAALSLIEGERHLETFMDLPACA